MQPTGEPWAQRPSVERARFTWRGAEIAALREIVPEITGISAERGAENADDAEVAEGVESTDESADGAESTDEAESTGESAEGAESTDESAEGAGSADRRESAENAESAVGAESAESAGNAQGTRTEQNEVVVAGKVA